MIENHRYANMFPLLEGEELKQLADDIKSNGLVHPITLYEEKILDGRNRYKGCLLAKVKPKFVQFNGGDPVSFVISCNSSRRDLTASQRACAAVNATQLIARLQREAKERSYANLNVSDGPKLVHLVDSGRTNEKLADLFKTSKGYIIDAFAIKRLKAEIEWLAEKGYPYPLNGEVKRKKHPLWIKLAKEKAELGNLFSEVFAGHMSIADAKRSKDRFIYDKKIVQAEIDKQEVPHIVLADPPWTYNEPGATTSSRQIKNQYNSLTLDEIKTKGPITTPDAILFLWATQPLLREALEVMDAWGFEYKTGAIWDKQIIGAGHWFRNQHELLLVGVRGEVSPPAEFLRVSSIFREKRTIHSRKPNCVYEWIEKAFPEERKLEMFARDVREGWQSMGNEV